MRWEGERESENVEDRRGSSGLRIGVGGGLGAAILYVLYLLLGGDPNKLQQNVPDQSATEPAAGGTARSGEEAPGQDRLRHFVGAVLASTEDAWTSIFASMGRTYREPTLVLFTGATDSACGFARAAVGPFYCSQDEQVYIDLSFYRDLEQRFGAPGEFAQAYVLAHEVGHHVQNLLGIMDKVEASRERGDEQDANALSVRLELQADCLAGVWAHSAASKPGLIEPGDIEAGLRAAAAIGDDRLQMRSRGYVAPESFTHGSSAQRVRWFRRGIESGDLNSCDTFGADER